VSVIDEVKSRLDIVEVISSYVPLQKSGRNYKALCPFHSEKTPSFVVFPESQRWHCFGACGEGGDVFTFVMKREGWDFRTALQELAQRAGVELRPRTPAQVQAEEEADRLRGLLDAAAQYYHHLLRHAPEAEGARAYVAQRDLDGETVERFLLGYSLPGWERARTYLTGRGYTVEELAKAGLLVQREESGSTYDRFRSRLMIPIRDARGRVIGFGARALDLGTANQGAKYINSPQTALFDKSRTLYGLDLARQAIHREDRVVIVEGYMDVMQAHQAGFANVVAQMGTALTEPQLRQLQRYTRRLVLALDPDAAGIQATLRGVEVAQKVLEQEWKPVFDPRGLIGYEARLGAEIRVIQLPRGQDPDDLIRQSPQRWAALVEDAKPVVEFYMQHLLESSDVDDPKVKKSIADAMLPILRSVPDPVERSAYGQKLARALEVSAPQFLHELERQTRQTTARRGREIREKESKGQGAETPLSDMLGAREADLESHCLSALLQRPTVLSQVNEALGENQLPPLQEQDFEGAGHRAIFEAWEALLMAEPLASAETLYGQLPPDLQVQLEELLALGEDWLADEQLIRDITLTLLRLRERSLKRLGQELSLLTTEAQEAGDLRADQYAAAWLSHTETLLRTQQALAQQRGWMPRL
jgi:DNA primase